MPICKACKMKFRPNDLYKRVCGPYCREIWSNKEANRKWVAACPSKQLPKKSRFKFNRHYDHTKERMNDLDKKQRRALDELVT